MKPQTISYKRTRDLGNGEIEEIELTAAIGTWEPNQVIEFLKTSVYYLSIFTSQPSPPPEEFPQAADRI